MNNAIFNFREPQNEPILEYLPGSKEQELLSIELARQKGEKLNIPLIIGGKEIYTGITENVIMPGDHKHVLATFNLATAETVRDAIYAAMEAKEHWMNLSWLERASIMMKAAELISTKYRNLILAASMLNQGKTVYQAEIDSACEVIDFLRFNVHFASKIYVEQPVSSSQFLNRVEYRPLEGFVYTVSPFNFTAIAANLNTSVALMGNTTIWKPSSASILSNYYFMKILQEAGLPDGVINFLPGKGPLISELVLSNPDFGGLHYTGSNETFNTLWKQITDNLGIFKSYPRIVGETGGKGFIFAHKSAHPAEVTTAIIRGAFEYQGQKCSAASRAYIPASLWDEVRDKLLKMTSEIKLGDVADFDNFMNAVIDEKSFDNIMKYIDLAKKSADCMILAGGSGDKSSGYYIRPTIIVTTDPHFITMEKELFGPVISIYVYKDEEYEAALKLCDQTSPYALTGSIFSQDRYALTLASRILRYSAGNMYFNDKPTGAMVGQQPFGGSRASGTNDKSGSYLNLLRWVSPRTIKETLSPPTDFSYPHIR